MLVLVTGAKGFIGKHVVKRLKIEQHDVLEFDVNNNDEELKGFINKADFIIHLAGINRPLTKEEFYDGNANLTKKVVDLVKESGKNTPIIMSSSIQASLDNDYGKSKKMGEDYLLNSSLPVYVYRLANVFGKWCRPNYNSACATFCYNIAHDLDIVINNEATVVRYNYIDDIVDSFMDILKQNEYQGSKEILYVNPTYECSLGRLASLLRYFKQEVESDRHLPLIHDEFEFKLFKTFLDYLSDEGSSYNFASDNRGSFEELYKSKKYGQISDNMSYPGITKGGHYHTYKKEIFYVVEGTCRIRQQNIETGEILDVTTSGDKPEPIEIKVGYTHEITNVGKTNSHTIMWISEVYSDLTPDTFRKPIE